MEEHQIILKLNESINKIEEFKKQALLALEKLSDFKESITDKEKKLKLFNEIFPNINLLKKELKEEINKIIVSINSSYYDELKEINKEKINLINRLDEIIISSKREKEYLHNINQQLIEQNHFLSNINQESKTYINQYFQEIESLKKELDLIKQNFELKYVYNKKRILLTSFFSLGLLSMIIISTVSFIYMFLYSTSYIFFPKRSDTLIIGILLVVLSMGLLGLLIIILIKPPVFLKTKKKSKTKE